MFSTAEICNAMMLLWTKRKIATAISPRIAVARTISSSVNPARRRSLSLAINIKLDLARLLWSAAPPLRSQGYEIDPVDLDVVLLLQRLRNRFLDKHDVAVSRRDFCFFFLIGKTGRRLHFCHSIRQDLPDTIFLGAKPARIQAILNRAPERDHSERKNRETDENFIKRERQPPISPHKKSSPSAPSAPNSSPSISHPVPGNSPWPARNFLTARKSTALVRRQSAPPETKRGTIRSLLF